MIRLLAGALAALALAAPAQAQHLTVESIAKVLTQADQIDNPKVKRVPHGLPLGAEPFANRPW